MAVVAAPGAGFVFFFSLDELARFENIALMCSLCYHVRACVRSCVCVCLCWVCWLAGTRRVLFALFVCILTPSFSSPPPLPLPFLFFPGDGRCPTTRRTTSSRTSRGASRESLSWRCSRGTVASRDPSRFVFCVCGFLVPHLFFFAARSFFFATGVEVLDVVVRLSSCVNAVPVHQINEGQ